MIYNILVMAQRLSRRVLSAQVYDVLRERITTLDITPGTRIDIGSLCKELDVSPIPVREALKSLTERCLVETKPNVGYHVATLTDQDVHEIFRLRRLLEGDALESSIRGLDVEEVAQFKERNESLLSEPVPLETQRVLFDEADVMLHKELLVGRSHNSLLIHFYDILADLMQIAMHLSARIEPSVREHVAILDALIEGDLPAAKASLWKHLENIEEACLPLPRSEEEWIERRKEVIGR